MALESMFMDVHIGLREYRINNAILPKLEVILKKFEKELLKLSLGQLSIFVSKY
jgi:hypothetical protein